MASRQIFLLFLPFQTYCSNMTAEAYILSVELDYHTPQPERYRLQFRNDPRHISFPIERNARWYQSSRDFFPFFPKHQSQRYNDELPSVRGRVPLPPRDENEPPQQVHHLVMTVRLGRSFAGNVRFHSHDKKNSIIGNMACCDHWDVKEGTAEKKKRRGLDCFFQQLSSDLASERIDSGNRNHRLGQKKIKRKILPHSLQE